MDEKQTDLANGLRAAHAALRDAQDAIVVLAQQIPDGIRGALAKHPSAPLRRWWDGKHAREILAALGIADGSNGTDIGIYDASKSAAEIALDDIAAACGCAEWEYPGQVTRDVLGVVARLEAAQSILKGRTTPPTGEEIEAHHRAGGTWYVASTHGRALTTTRADAIALCGHLAANKHPATWWAIDTRRRPCAWPVVTEASR
jgi:hypothetical protein